MNPATEEVMKDRTRWGDLLSEPANKEQAEKEAAEEEQAEKEAAEKEE